MSRVQKNCEVSFKLPDGLRERYKAASFLQAFFQNGGFEINGKFFDNHLNDEAKAKRNSDALERIAIYCRRVVDTLDKLNCSDDIFISQMKPIDWCNLDSLVKAILDNVPIKNLRAIARTLVNMTLESFILPCVQNRIRLIKVLIISAIFSL